MSEAERKRRSDYKKNRMKWMIIQLVAIVLISAIFVGCFLTYRRLNRTYYIDYVEKGNIDYYVMLKENEFYEEEYREEGQSYVASLIDKIRMDLEYQLSMDAENVNYEYSYRVDAQLEIVDRESGAKIFAPTYALKEAQTFTAGSNNELKIKEFVDVDYAHYNDIANRFISVYQLDSVVSTLVVSLNVDVVGSCDAFETESENDYAVSLRIPLTTKTVNIKMTSSVPDGESKVLACQNGGSRIVFKVLAILFGILDIVAVGLFIAFVYLTRNDDINYSIKVKKLLSNYRSYIQQINNEFDTNGYQLLYVNTFNEMLGIRDTIQSPILMYENGDQTCTQFLIPTNTKLLYLFEVRVEDYDALYAENEPVEDTPDDLTFDDEMPAADTEAEELRAENPEEEINEEEELFDSVSPEELDALLQSIPSEEEPAEDAEEVDEPEAEGEEPLILDEEIDREALVEALESPDVDLDSIEYDEPEEEVTEDGVEVVSVVWPEPTEKSTVYRYDPDGAELDRGDVVLVPTPEESERETIRKAAVARGNHKVAPESLNHPLKKIIGVVRRKAEQMLMPDEDTTEK